MDHRHIILIHNQIVTPNGHDNLYLCNGYEQFVFFLPMKLLLQMLLQMLLLEPSLCIMDETDSGLDIDALQVVASGVNAMRSADRSFILVTHYQRLLNFIEPDFVHVLSGGRIVRSGDKSLALELEEKGYGWIEDEVA